VEKKLAQQTARVQAEHPEADVEVWTMDEHRLGLKPVLDVVPKEQPIAQVNWRFQCYGCMALFSVGRNVLVDSAQS